MVFSAWTLNVRADWPTVHRVADSLRTYDVDVTREGDSWLAEVRGVPGAHTYAGNVTALRQNVLEVIALVNDDSPDVEHPALRLHFADDRTRD
jgi:predicted RNase H-like HicB family nuclease